MVDLESRSGPLQVINASLMDSLYIRMCDWETRGVDLLTSLGLPASSAEWKLVFWQYRCIENLGLSHVVFGGLSFYLTIR